ncbi:MAG: energy transducer TonB [Acidobacteria bacterium]|nr:energy transducer TonB [Acidobacteriota bacterium]
MLKFFVFLALLSANVAAQQPKIDPPRPDGAPQIRESFNFPRYPNFFRVGEIKGKIAPAKAIYLPTPTFPENAREAGVDGKVRVDIIIATDGTVSSAKSVSGAKEFFPAAETAAVNSRFLPPGIEVAAYLTYEFIIRKPNWFLVAFDLYTIPDSNPGVIRKAFPSDWAEEIELAERLIEIGRRRPPRPNLVGATRTATDNTTMIRASVSLPSPELNAAATNLAGKIRLRLAADPASLRQFELAEGFIQALTAFRNPAMQNYSTGLLRRFVDESPENLPPTWIARLRGFLADERGLAPGAYVGRLHLMINEFRLFEVK